MLTCSGVWRYCLETGKIQNPMFIFLYIRNGCHTVSECVKLYAALTGLRADDILVKKMFTTSLSPN